MKTKIKYAGMALIGITAPYLLSAEEAAATAPTPVPFIDFGNTAWMIVATALVMLMTIPGLALFYGGLVRQKTVLNILMQCFILTAAITLEWVFFGYSLSFSSSTGALI
jgi:Amt family ammonium transporter